LRSPAFHHHLDSAGHALLSRFVIESGEPRGVHHFALLLGYGAAAINPYVAFETLRDMIARGFLLGFDVVDAADTYRAIQTTSRRS